MASSDDKVRLAPGGRLSTTDEPLLPGNSLDSSSGPPDGASSTAVSKPSLAEPGGVSGKRSRSLKRGPDLKLDIPKRPESVTPGLRPETGSAGVGLYGKAAAMDEESSSDDSDDDRAHALPMLARGNLRFRGAAQAVRLTKLQSRSRLSELTLVTPVQSTPRGSQRDTPKANPPSSTKFSNAEPTQMGTPRGGPRSPLRPPRSPTKSLGFKEEEEDPFKIDEDALTKEFKQSSGLSRMFMWAQILLMVALVGGIIALAIVQPRANNKRLTWLGLVIWQWLMLVFVIVCGRLIATWAVRLLVLVIERNFLLRHRVLYFVYGLRLSVVHCLWLAQVLIVWLVLVDISDGHEDELRIVTRILISAQIASVLILVKVLLVKIAANGFHRRAYFERIQDTLFHQYVLERLSAPSTVVAATPAPTIPASGANVTGQLPASPLQPGSVKLDIKSPSGDPIPALSFRGGLGGTSQPATPKMTETSWRPPTSKAGSFRVPLSTPVQSHIPISNDKLQGLTSETVSALGLKKLIHFVRSSKIQTFTHTISHQGYGDEISSEIEAKVVAKQVFKNVASPGVKFITEENLCQFMSEADAERAFTLFEGAETGKITKKALVNWVVGVYKERRSLALTLSDTKTVVGKLHRVLDCILSAFLLIVFLLVFQVDTARLLVLLSSTLLAAVFVFGESCKETFQSLIFLFVTHPYDVGDRVRIDGLDYLVEELNILNTVFLAGDGTKVYFPNMQLRAKSIGNYYRSPDQWESFDFQVHNNTPAEKLALLKQQMIDYVAGLPQMWYPHVKLLIKEIEDSARLRMGLSLQHRMNFQEMGDRMTRRSDMIAHFRKSMKELQIGYDAGPANIKLHADSVVNMHNRLLSTS